MLGGLLLRLLLATALCPGLLVTAPVPNPQLCEGYAGPDGRSRPGFYCPRLSDPPGHRYCCRGPRALKSCCPRPAPDAPDGANRSGPAGPRLLRHPLALPFVGLYGLLVLLLAAADLLHFYRRRRCRPRRLPPCAPCPPRAPPAGRRPRARPARAPGGLPPLPRAAPGRAC